MDIHSLMNNDAPAGSSRLQHHGAPPPEQHRERERESVRQQQRNSFPPPPPQQRSASGAYSSTHGSPLNAPPPPPPAYYAPKPQVPAYQHNASLPSTPMALHTPQQQFPGGQYPFPAQQSPQQPYPHPHPPPLMTPRQQSQPSYQHSMSPTPPNVVHRSPQVYPNTISQPSTPFGPPIPPYARQPSQPQLQHQRTVSGASYGIQHAISAPSPAHSLPPHSAYPIESPQAYHKRRSIGYLSNADRDRSLSVSPKTKLVLPTRNNSQDASSWDDRDMYASNEPPQSSHRSSGDMSNSQAISPLTTTKNPLKASPSSQPRIGSQTPQLRNLLNDDPPHHRSPMMASSPATAHAPSIPPPPPHFSHSQSSLSNGSPVQTFTSRPVVQQEPPSAFASESLLQQPVAPVNMSQSQHSTLKRAASSDPERVNPPKKTKKRYAEPPVWARYAPGNPRYDPKVAQSLGPPEVPMKRTSPRPALHVVPPQQSQHQQQQQQQQQSQSQPQPQPPIANGHGPPSMSNGQGPPTNSVNPSLGPWESNIKNFEPLEPMIHTVVEYLFNEMLIRPDVGAGDARSGALEIEAKLGTLVDKNTDQRLRLPITTPVVLAREYSQHLRFESFMTDVQHKCMNDYLNKCLLESIQPGRVKMEYKHRYEVDSFAPFTPAGLEALPPSAKKYMDDHRRRTAKLRTTIDERAPEGADPVIARIVKIRLADLDIYSPQHEFDCRISINIEVDMNNRPDIDLSLIVDENDTKSMGERKKDRLSYKHLAYSVDLTQVKTADGRKIHELEIEVDTVRLREQAERAHSGAPEAFEALVRGLISNVFTLMRVPMPRR